MEHILLSTQWSRPREDMAVSRGSPAEFTKGKWCLPNLPACCCGNTGLGMRGEQRGPYIMTLQGVGCGPLWYPCWQSGEMWPGEGEKGKSSCYNMETCFRH